MIVSHSNKFIYFKSYKTASTSVEIFFEQFCNDKDIVGYRGPSPVPNESKWWNHMPPQEIKDKMEDDQAFDSYFKFGCVRNPWDRKLSSYFFCNQSKIFIDKLDIPKTFEEYCMRPNEKHFSVRTLYNFFDVENTNVDYFIRFEKLHGDINEVCNALNLECDLSHLTHKKKTDHTHYTEYYTDEMRDKVAEDFREDIDFFNYTFGD